MALGQLKLGDMVYYFPRYVITGYIGGITVFVTVTGLEVSGKAVKFVLGRFTGPVTFHSATEIFCTVCGPLRVTNSVVHFQALFPGNHHQIGMSCGQAHLCPCRCWPPGQFRRQFLRVPVRA